MVAGYSGESFNMKWWTLMAFSLFCALHNTVLYSSTSVECVILVMLLIVVGFCRGLHVSSEFWYVFRCFLEVCTLFEKLFCGWCENSRHWSFARNIASDILPLWPICIRGGVWRYMAVSVQLTGCSYALQCVLSSFLDFQTCPILFRLPCVARLPVMRCLKN